MLKSITLWWWFWLWRILNFFYAISENLAIEDLHIYSEVNLRRTIDFQIKIHDILLFGKFITTIFFFFQLKKLEPLISVFLWIKNKLLNFPPSRKHVITELWMNPQCSILRKTSLIILNECIPRLIIIIIRIKCGQILLTSNVVFCCLSLLRANREMTPYNNKTPSDLIIDMNSTFATWQFTPKISLKMEKKKC